jgi:LysR family transcriptional activator of nhaA
MLNYNHLYYFHMAALEGSVASAAAKLRVTQPTVSEQVRALERTLGVALFERLPTGLRLTDAGKLTFEHTSVMFRASERLSQALGRGDGDLPRALRIGISGAVGRATSTKFLLPLLALDDCIPSIRSSDTVELLRDLRTNELDLVLCESEPLESARQGLEVKVLDQLALIAVGAPDLEPALDWHDVGLVHYRPSSAFRWDVESFLELNNLRPKVVAETDDALFLLEAAARGGYLAFVPRSVARDSIASGRLKPFARIDSSRAGVYALYQDGVTSDLARRAVDTLIEHLRTHHDD